MGCEVYANGDEIACKAGDGKVIAAFPDVCLTPPAPPAGPIPVPYPDTSFSKDMKKGSKTVKIKRKEVMLKDLSYYKTSPLGDEAATKSQGAGVITHVITGKTYFVSWSMDVLFEGKNIDRHADMTTSNHASPMANANLPTPNIASKAPSEEIQSTKCECCGGAVHSAAQARGEHITEEEFHAPSQTGLRKVDEKGNKQVLKPQPLTKNMKSKIGEAQAAIELMREECPDQVPNNPPEGPCDYYYRVSAPEKQAADKLFEALNNPTNKDRPEAWAESNVKMIAHRVPRSGGGCPVGMGNTRAVTDSTCAEFDGVLGSVQNEVVLIARDHPLD
ncbi:DUF4150 domain-containing protein [Pseudomonas chlororaphis]|uniref:DUF4150 domain-containing protein n=1 Tax=Pseudomonas chlororaphis TaxID=587753 RepID=UPI000D10B004|nr:DUF4150 domain-containing protein [Pseudomonas chlororaphis]AVO59675.1 hypothetical protein C6Q18_17485 [Pseudomonas chlororaphis subsp. piscium]